MINIAELQFLYDNGIGHACENEPVPPAKLVPY